VRDLFPRSACKIVGSRPSHFCFDSLVVPVEPTRMTDFWSRRAFAIEETPVHVRSEPLHEVWCAANGQVAACGIERLNGIYTIAVADCAATALMAGHPICRATPAW
jgi:hypothetical protein